MVKKFLSVIFAMSVAVASISLCDYCEHAVYGEQNVSLSYSSGSDADAKTAVSASKVKKEYAKALTNGSIEKKIVGTDIKFAIKDINCDGTPELLVTGDNKYHLYIYNYVSGKVNLLYGDYGANLAVYPKKGLIENHVKKQGKDQAWYYKYDGKKLTELAGKYGDKNINALTGKKKTTTKEKNTYGPYLYKVKGSNTTSAEYQTYKKKLLGTLKKGALTYHTNNVQNRINYLGSSEIKLSKAEADYYKMVLKDKLYLQDSGGMVAMSECFCFYDVNADGRAELLITGNVSGKSTKGTIIYSYDGKNFRNSTVDGVVTKVSKQGIYVEYEEIAMFGQVRYNINSVYSINQSGKLKLKFETIKTKNLSTSKVKIYYNKCDSAGKMKNISKAVYTKEYNTYKWIKPCLHDVTGSTIKQYV